MAKASSSSKSKSDANVLAVQRALGAYYKGKLDGIFGTLTKDAIMAALGELQSRKTLDQLATAIDYLTARMEEFKRTLTEQGEREMGKTDDLIAKVQEQTTVVSGVGALMDGLSARLKEVSDQLKSQGADTAKLDEAIAEVENNTTILQAAVVRNTPTAENEDTHGLTT